MFNLKRKQYKLNSSHKSSKKKYFKRLLVFLGIFFLLSLAFLVYKSNFLTIKVLKLTLNDISCADEGSIKNNSGILGKNYFFINENSISSSLKKKFNCISSIKLKKNFPDKVVAEVFGRKPVAVISLTERNNPLNLDLLDATASSQAALLEFETKDFNKQILVDQTGFLFEENKNPSDLPLIYIEDMSLNIGRQLGTEVIGKTLEINDYLKNLEIEIKTEKIQGSRLLVDGKPKLVFALDKDLKRQIASLQLILQKAKMDSKEINLIDLRFDKPVVTYSK